MQGNDGRARVRLPDEPLAPAREPARGVSVQAPDTALVHALEGHVASLKAELETLKAELRTRNSELASANARAVDEAAKTAQAIAAFESLAQRLEAMAAERAIKPWWQRLLRAG
jgi:hypothetical protein